MKFAPLIALFLICALLAYGLVGKSSTPTPSPLIGKPLPAFTVGDRNLDDLLDGHTVVLNVFASWCAPCALEHPQLMTLKAQVPIIGIAWKNKPGEVTAWLTRHGNPYASLLMDEIGESTMPLGLTGVPETFVIAPDGIVAYHTAQPITAELLASDILPLIERLEP